MKAALKISLVLNLGLAGCLVYILVHPWRAGDTPVQPATAAATRPAQTVAASPPPVAQPEEPKPFRWSQLESLNDYRIFLANLRAIGCPEPTVEDIVRGDTERAFSFKRRQLNLDGSGTGPWSAWRETQLVANLLGEPLAVAAPTEQSPARDGMPLPPPSYPLVMQSVDLDALGLNEDQKQVIARIRQQFTDAIGGTNQNPDDPAYLARWQKAQPESDNMIKGLLGVTIFENYQLAARESSQDATAGKP